MSLKRIIAINEKLGFCVFGSQSLVKGMIPIGEPMNIQKSDVDENPEKLKDYVNIALYGEPNAYSAGPAFIKDARKNEIFYPVQFWDITTE